MYYLYKWPFETLLLNNSKMLRRTHKGINYIWHSCIWQYIYWDIIGIIRDIDDVSFYFEYMYIFTSYIKHSCKCFDTNPLCFKTLSMSFRIRVPSESVIAPLISKRHRLHFFLILVLRTRRSNVETSRGFLLVYSKIPRVLLQILTDLP